ncbi:MAG: FAD-binding protein, partial [Myxococcales bacterium]|nr:FAD-binding protein [Myxococcales bacterium]
MAEILRQHGISGVEEGADLSTVTSYKVGGPAELLIRPDSEAALADALRLLAENNVDYAVVGWGSNLIVADEGFAGAVIQLGPGFRYVTVPAFSADATSVEVEVGAATMNNHLVRELHKN